MSYFSCFKFATIAKQKGLTLDYVKDFHTDTPEVARNPDRDKGKDGKLKKSPLTSREQSFVEASSEVQVLIDELKVKQVLINLISNGMSKFLARLTILAVKFTEKGGIVIGSRVQLLSPHNALVTITVTDTGVGFSDEGEKLFTKFVQVHNTNLLAH